ATTEPAGSQPSLDYAEVVARLRMGDEATFTSVVERYHPALVGVAARYVGGNRLVAEEVAQEAWLALLTGLEGVRAPSSLKAWLFRVVVNRAKSRGQLEKRWVPSMLVGGWDGDDEPPPRSGYPPSSARECTGRWVSVSACWEDLPEERLLICEEL